MTCSPPKHRTSLPGFRYMSSIEFLGKQYSSGFRFSPSSSGNSAIRTCLRTLKYVRLIHSQEQAKRLNQAMKVAKLAMLVADHPRLVSRPIHLFKNAPLRQPSLTGPLLSSLLMDTSRASYRTSIDYQILALISQISRKRREG
jgi:hypothetical protein